jgi:hypothetical protein
MSIRTALILTGVWTLLLLAGCAGVVAYIANGPRHQQEARAGRAGGGFGTLAAIGYGAIWLPWAAAYGKQRRERLEREKRHAEDDEEGRPRKRRRT